MKMWVGETTLENWSFLPEDSKLCGTVYIEL